MKISSIKIGYISVMALVFGVSAFSSSLAATDNRPPCATRGPTGNEFEQCPLIFWSDPDTADYVSVRANPGDAKNPIDVPVAQNVNACWYVDNKSSGTPFFVPFRSPDEWHAFITSVENDNKIATLARLTACARKTLAPVEPSDSCTNPSSNGEPIDETPVTFALPYERIKNSPEPYPSASGYVKIFNCNGKSLQIVKETWVAEQRSPDQPPPSSGSDWPYKDSGWEVETLIQTNGGCGPAAGVPTADAPEDDDLCSGPGVVGYNLKRGVPWTWMCKATGTDKITESVKCSAPLKPLCGAATEEDSPTKPTQFLCASGTASDVASKSGKWVWTCTGSSVVTCSTGIGDCNCEKKGKCGPAAGHPVGSAPTAGLCSSGGTASPVSHVNKTWVWKCTFPKNTVSCSARDCGCD